MAICALAAMTTIAGATHIADPEVEKGSKELELLSRLGFSLPRDPDATRREFAAQFGYGVTDNLAVKFIGTAEQPRNGQLEFSAVAVETTLQLLKLEEQGLIAGWLTSVEAGTRSDDTNTVVFGPAVKLTRGPMVVVANALFEKTFGRNTEDGTALNYMILGVYEVAKDLRIGAMLDGTVPNLANPPPFSEQELSLAPVALKGFKLDESRTLTLSAGAFFGLTDATADLTVRTHVKLGW